MASLTITDLSHHQTLSNDALSAVRGGSNFNFGNVNAAFGGGFASPAIVVAPVIQTDTKIDIPTLQNFGGLQFLKGLF
ncbi:MULTISPECIES: hypothetical protein [Paraburkholderia]|jgi:hypothetical protein|uniref:Uncharacterized protein n=1 Tax=Paraburkholderia largidicola TaxID=3014751 RepID=A0A7I8BRG0_9BURK|nr:MULTISPECIES: hypothetical protein [Paraburkholderia]BEU25161.1 hypothetical protein PBP221_53010 [Paraburkholderia sp. 22B1P]GJH37665.1 hypothetical protein CBA19CS91_32930 [Paraburkholderia hospita]CAG9245672.1 conserved hypothetical protein [Paraburkholderia caribensis]BCF91356.1 hypothetical protein PPGU16_44230 [Paraburkholderia sp. PGU16]BCF91363.1 hypothetical protein PPGU16_44300 [Paraburkholderia sp. PGU16]